MAAKRKTTRRTRTPARKNSKSSLSALLSAFIIGAVAVGGIWFMTFWANINRPKMQLPPNNAQNPIKFNLKPAQSSPPPKQTVNMTHTTVTKPPISTSSSTLQPIKPEHYYLVYLKNYSDFQQADNERAYLILRGFDAKVSKSTLLHNYMLWIGPFSSLEIAYHTQIQLKSEYQNSHITTN